MSSHRLSDGSLQAERCSSRGRFNELVCTSDFPYRSAENGL